MKVVVGVHRRCSDGLLRRGVRLLGCRRARSPSRWSQACFSRPMGEVWEHMLSALHMQSLEASIAQGIPAQHPIEGSLLYPRPPPLWSRLPASPPSPAALRAEAKQLPGSHAQLPFLKRAFRLRRENGLRGPPSGACAASPALGAGPHARPRVAALGCGGGTLTGPASSPPPPPPPVAPFFRARVLRGLSPPRARGAPRSGVGGGRYPGLCSSWDFP